MKSLDAVLFDIDSTLLSSNVSDAVVATCNKLSTYNSQLVANELLASNGRIWSEHGQRFEYEWTMGIIDGASIANETWRLTLSGCGCSDESIVRFAAQTYSDEELKTYRLFDDVIPLIDFLGSLRIPMGAVTNGAYDSQSTKLRATQVLDRFGFVITSGEIAIAKPDPRIFEIALEKLGANPQRTWHIGDSPSTDIMGANAAGIKAIWINRNGRLLREDEPAPDMEVASLTDLLPILRNSHY